MDGRTSTTNTGSELRRHERPAAAPSTGAAERRLVLCAPDKFRGTASGREIALAAAGAARACGFAAQALPLADGGEGLLDAVGGEPQTTRVTGPLGNPLLAEWRLLRDGDSLTAVIEMARASGLAASGGASRNDPVAATTRGTGELIAAALAAGARRVVVGCGGSATTDGGTGVLDVVGPRDLAGVELIAACDVTTPFLDAARVFAPQKGAGPTEVAALSERLERLAARYEAEFGIDVRTIARTGAAGGLGGALAVLGARLVSGFELVADLVGFASALEHATVVVTGEGRLDETSFAGKVVGEVVRHASQSPQRPGVLIVVGNMDSAFRPPPDVTVVSLAQRFGQSAAHRDPLGLVARVVGETLTAAPFAHRAPPGES